MNSFISARSIDGAVAHHWGTLVRNLAKSYGARRPPVDAEPVDMR